MRQAMIAIQNSHSILFRAANTILPIPKPIGNVTPGARNFNQASRKLIANTAPDQMKATAIDVLYDTAGLKATV